jgi:DNA-binding SARP family transcriptional activator
VLIRVLGDLEVTVDDEQVDLGGAKPRTLVGLLVAAEGRAVAIEQLIEEMWDGDPPARVEASLQTYVARLRRALDPGRTERGADERLRTHPGGYSLRQDDVEVDARVFAAEVQAARTEADPGRAVAMLTAALGRWRGEAYAGLGSAGLRAEAVRLGELRTAATEDLWQLRTDLGHHAEAVGALERLVAEHPLRERLWALLARALYLAARQGDALAALRRARTHLAEELGVDPGPELQALEQAVLRQDPALAPAPVVATPPPPPPEAAPTTPSLFGRDHELATAAELLADVAATGHGRVLVVEGESGIGKTRLADEVAELARSRGVAVGRGVWESDPCPPLWGWSRALGHAGVDPGVLVVPDGHDAASVSFQQAEQLLAALAGAGPVVLVLDDVQWADGESLRLLRRAAAGLAAAPVLLLVLVRREAAPSADLTGAVAALARLGADRLELTGLDPAAVHEWVRRRAGVEVGDQLAAGLVERTEGNPFYLGELVRLLASGGALSGSGADGWGSVPRSVQDVVRQRLGAIDPGHDDVVTAAAVAGRSFDLAVVADASGRPLDEVEEVTEALQVLGLVAEEGPGRYRFSHAIARDAVYGMLSGVARSRAHAAVGAALEARWSSTLGDHAAELARHYELAGPGYERSAWLFAHRAAVRAFEHAAYDEALRRGEHAVALQRQDTAAAPEELETVLVLVVRSLLRLGRPLDAWDPVARATRSALDRGDPAQAARTLVTISEDIVWGWRVHPSWSDEGIALWEEVLEASAGVVDRGTAALVRAGLSYELFYLPPEEPRATAHAEQAIREARHEAVPDRMRMRTLKLAIPALLRPEMRARRMPVYDEIIALATRLEDHATLAATLTHRAQDHGAVGRLDAMWADGERARRIAERHRLSEALVVSGSQAALRHQVRAEWEQALAVIEEVEELESTLAMSGRGITTCHRAMVLEAQGRLAEMEPVFAPMREWHPVFREIHSLSLVRAGRPDEARRLMGPWGDQPFLSRDYFTVALNALRSRTWAALGDQEAVAALRAALEPHADEMAIASGVIFLGSVHQSLGELAVAAGDRDAAEAHLRAALAKHAELGLDHWVARSRDALASLASLA